MDQRAAPQTEEEFRASTRQWLAENFPPSLKGGKYFLRHAQDEQAAPEYYVWRKRMADKGWGVPLWPARYGGGGLTSREAEILGEEMAQIEAFNPIGGLGVMMLGPTVLEFGTEEQKLQHIPPIARGELEWCQGFSEPGAGSDLASLRMRCEDRRDHFLVNGQKIWTSFAHIADWCFCLVRTDTSRKQGGISFLLIDMRSEGVEPRPISLINGVSHFCETFFTDVKVPKENLLGEVNGGWAIAKRLLQHERNGLSSQRNVANVERGLPELARHYVGTDAGGRIADADMRARLVSHMMRQNAYRMTLKHRNAEIEAGLEGSAPMSVLKNLGACIAQDLNELALEILGAAGLGWEGPGFNEEELELTSGWLYSKCFSIYGGSHEIQNNITAKRVLALPDA
ncbi:MAG: acyl-CoA dehydrogenase family protein [Sphingobium sp.]|nr:acyl-CoA dehydrogenase family protein [Sphingobium sp.]MBP8670481.1 acyl-CoA dehydrogenase family protein [Sphingobium sp.]MBP9156916.1 acyl-CoA dehydrogenase family protein [Sphingobium sp.]